MVVKITRQGAFFARVLALRCCSAMRVEGVGGGVGGPQDEKGPTYCHILCGCELSFFPTQHNCRHSVNGQYHEMDICFKGTVYKI
jgi:hypothetical protein